MYNPLVLCAPLKGEIADLGPLWRLFRHPLRILTHNPRPISHPGPLQTHRELNIPRFLYMLL